MDKGIREEDFFSKGEQDAYGNPLKKNYDGMALGDRSDEELKSWIDKWQKRKEAALQKGDTERAAAWDKMISEWQAELDKRKTDVGEMSRGNRDPKAYSFKFSKPLLNSLVAANKQAGE